MGTASSYTSWRRYQSSPLHFPLCHPKGFRTPQDHPAGPGAPANALPRTGVGMKTLAVEHLSLLDVADAPMVAGVGVAGVVAALSHPTAVQHIAAFLPQVVHLVVHIQEADAALQASRSRGTLCHSEETKDTVGRGEKHQRMEILFSRPPHRDAAAPLLTQPFGPRELLQQRGRCRG